MRERLHISKTLSMSERMAEDVQRVATSLKVSFADVVRGCIENDLPKLKERERTRKKRGNDIKHNTSHIPFKFLNVLSDT